MDTEGLRYLDDHELDFTYMLVDCTLTMSPPGTLLSKPNGETYVELGTEYHFLYGQGIQHYVNIAATSQTYEEICGPAVYSITVADVSKAGFFEIINNNQLVVKAELASEEWST